MADSAKPEEKPNEETSDGNEEKQEQSQEIEESKEMDAEEKQEEIKNELPEPEPEPQPELSMLAPNQAIEGGASEGDDKKEVMDDIQLQSTGKREEMDTEVKQEEINDENKQNRDTMTPTDAAQDAPSDPPSTDQTDPTQLVDGADKVSVIETAKPGDVFTDDSPSIPQPLTLSWSFGYNSTLPVHNTSYSDKKMLFYACNQSGILYDCNNHKQHLLQGHGNPITCTAVSSDKRWLVTADIGYSPLLIVWDSYTAVPVRTYFDGLNQGTIAIAISHDSKLIATIGITMPQVLSIWDWTDESDKPVHTISIPLEHGLQTYVTFYQGDSSILVSNSEESVVFYKWDHTGIKLHCTPLTDKDFNRSPGYLSQTVFVPDNDNFAVTATSTGCGIVWGTTGIHLEKVDPATLQVHHKSPIKLMVLHDSPITTVTTHQQYIVTGDTEGHVKFYDINLTLINWYDRFKLGPIVSISFAFDTNLTKQVNAGNKYPDQSTLEAKPFVIPNFVVSSATANVSHITANGTIQDVIMRESESGVPCIATHPSDTRMAITSFNGTVKLWDYHRKVVIVTRSFSGKSSLTAIQFDHKGEFIGVGFSNGDVRVLCSVSLEDRSPVFNYSQEPITHIAFSITARPSLYMATAGLDLTTSVYVLADERINQTKQKLTWTFLARHKAHYKKIGALTFGVSPDTGLPRLLSLSDDRHIVEYDLMGSSVDDLKLLSVDRIEQSAVPTAIAWYPPIGKESFLLTANNQFKLKLYNSTTKMCRKTLLGPTYGSPLNKIAIIPLKPGLDSPTGDDNRYLAYITKDKVGLLILPHNGNPHNTMCLVAHAQNVSDLATSYDGQYVFTAGGEDCTVNMWAVDTNALKVASTLGGPELEPFYSLIDGGREGSFFAELEEFFYYAQIKSQGSDSGDTRQVSLHVPLEQVPFIMRAIGFFPSEQEIENMLNEVKFSRYAENGQYVSQIDLEDFIKLYINHRPVQGLTPGLFANAFKSLGLMDFETKQWKIDRSHLLAMLQERGEHLTETELVEHLMTLLGYCDNPEREGMFVAGSDPDDVLLSEIPALVSAQEFAENIVGLTA